VWRIAGWGRIGKLKGARTRGCCCGGGCIDDDGGGGGYVIMMVVMGTIVLHWHHPLVFTTIDITL